LRHSTQITTEQRYQISALMKAGFNQSKIATDLGRNKTTNYRELKGNKEQRIEVLIITGNGLGVTRSAEQNIPHFRGKYFRAEASPDAKSLRG